MKIRFRKILPSIFCLFIFLSLCACKPPKEKINYQLSILIFHQLDSDHYPPEFNELCLPIENEKHFLSCSESPVNIYSSNNLNQALKSLNLGINKESNLNVIAPHRTCVIKFFSDSIIPNPGLTSPAISSNRIAYPVAIESAKGNFDKFFIFSNNRNFGDSSIPVVGSIEDLKIKIFKELETNPNLKKVAVLFNPPIENNLSNESDSKIRIPDGFISIAKDIEFELMKIADPTITWKSKNDKLIPQLLNRYNLNGTAIATVNNNKEVFNEDQNISDYLSTIPTTHPSTITIKGLVNENDKISKLYIHEKR